VYRCHIYKNINWPSTKINVYINLNEMIHLVSQIFNKLIHVCFKFKQPIPSSVNAIGYSLVKSFCA